MGKHHPNIFESVEVTRKDQAATELKLAQRHAAIQPPQKKRKYRIVNQCLAQFKQEYVMGKDLYLSVLFFCLQMDTYLN